MEFERTPSIWWWWSTSKCKSKDIGILLYMLWTMCHVYGSTIDVDRFFQTEKNTERESHNYMAEKKRLELFSLGI